MSGICAGSTKPQNGSREESANDSQSGPGGMFLRAALTVDSSFLNRTHRVAPCLRGARTVLSVLPPSSHRQPTLVHRNHRQGPAPQLAAPGWQPTIAVFRRVLSRARVQKKALGVGVRCLGAFVVLAPSEAFRLALPLRKMTPSGQDSVAIPGTSGSRTHSATYSITATPTGGAGHS